MKVAHVLALAVAAAVTLSTTGCAASGTGAGAGSDGAIVVGFIDDLSGPTAVNGKLDLQSTQLYVDQVNKTGGINGHLLNLVSYDNKNDPALTTQLATRLVTQDKAIVLTCCAASATTAAAAAVAGQLKVPLVTSGAEQSLTAPDKPWAGYLFRGVAGNDILAQQLVDWVKGKGLTKVALETSSLSYGTAAVSFYTKAIPASGGQVVAKTTMDLATTDASVQAAQIIQSGADVVVSWDYPSPVAQLVKALRAAGSTIPVVSNYSALQPTMVSIAGSAVGNLYAQDGTFSDNKGLTDFSDQWKAKYQQVPVLDIYHVASYSLGMIIGAAAGKAKSLDAAGMQDAIIALDCVHTLIGTSDSCFGYGKGVYDGARNGQFVSMKKYNNGTWESIS